MHEQINDFSVLINKHTCLSSLALLCISCLEFLTWNPESQVLVLSLNYHQFSSVESLNHVWLFATRWIAHARLPCPACWSLFRFMSIKSVMPSNHLILCRPLLLLPSVFPSIRVFSNESFHSCHNKFLILKMSQLTLGAPLTVWYTGRIQLIFFL